LKIVGAGALPRLSGIISVQADIRAFANVKRERPELQPAHELPREWPFHRNSSDVAEPETISYKKDARLRKPRARPGFLIGC
jgi:hypothetical protein